MLGMLLVVFTIFFLRYTKYFAKLNGSIKVYSPRYVFDATIMMTNWENEMLSSV